MSEPLICNRCGKILNRKTAKMLELDQRTNTFTDQKVPSEFSQGGFWFGKDCAEIELIKYDKSLRSDYERNYRS